MEVRGSTQLVSPLPSHVVLAFPPNDEPWPKRLDDIDHMELCHTSGIHFDVVVNFEGKQCSTSPNLHPLSYKRLKTGMNHW